MPENVGRLDALKQGQKALGGGWVRRVKFAHRHEDIISVENLLAAWKEFISGKKNKDDVQKFQHELMNNVLELHRKLSSGTYRHSNYQAFKISDPKPRDIHKASVGDRLVHHALYRKLYPFFDRTFISDSYSCRRCRGSHAAMSRFREFACRVSRNNTRTCWVLKCDIRKFFASIDQKVLLDIVRTYIADDRTNALIAEIVGSFNSTNTGKGLPLGNLTSQLLVNVYMNEFDQFVKHKLKARFYIRYADDFVILSDNRECLVALVSRINDFLTERLRLSLHPDKVFISTLASGVDFLGWVHFPNHRVLRTSTKRRMFKRITGLDKKDATTQSYLGMLRHGDTHTLTGNVETVLRKP